MWQKYLHIQLLYTDLRVALAWAVFVNLSESLSSLLFCFNKRSPSSSSFSFFLLLVHMVLQMFCWLSIWFYTCFAHWLFCFTHVSSSEYMFLHTFRSLSRLYGFTHVSLTESMFYTYFADWVHVFTHASLTKCMVLHTLCLLSPCFYTYFADDWVHGFTHVSLTESTFLHVYTFGWLSICFYTCLSD